MQTFAPLTALLASLLPSLASSETIVPNKEAFESCIADKKLHLLRLTLYEDRESKFFLRLPESAAQTCEVFWSEQKGTQSSVEVDFEELNELWRLKGHDDVFNGHTHIDANLNYFLIQSEPYSGEIQFVSEESIRAHMVSAGMLKSYIKAALENKWPLPSMSPPSSQDFNFLIENSSRSPLLEGPSVVASSGGVWVYKLNQSKRHTLKTFIQKLDKLATFYRRARDLNSQPRIRQASKLLLDNQLKKDPSIQALVEEWAWLGLELRAPFSEHAMEMALEQSNLELVHVEYARKLIAAKRLSALLWQHGAEVEFVPFFSVNKPL